VSPLRPDGRAPGFLPRGTAVERGSTAEGREGARAKRARSTTVSPLRPGGRAPSALTGHSPTPLTAMWGSNPKGLLPRWSGSGAEYGEGREGARAKRARSIDGFGTAPYPAAGSGDPFPLSLRSRGTKLSGGEIKKDFSPVGAAAERSTAKAGRGR